MTDKEPEYTPILEPIYDFRTGITKEEAVQYLLGWFQMPLVITPNFLSEEEIHDQYRKGKEEYEPSWLEILQEIREGLVIDYELAKQEEALAELKACDAVINKAHEYLCLIDDELAKGQESALRVDPETKHITIISLKEWASEILETNSNEASIVLKRKHDAIKEGGMSQTIEINLLVRFALLIEEYAETASGLQHGGKPNASAIATKLVQRAKDSTTPVNGISQSSMEKAISLAMRTKRGA